MADWLSTPPTPTRRRSKSATMLPIHRIHPTHTDGRMGRRVTLQRYICEQWEVPSQHIEPAAGFALLGIDRLFVTSSRSRSLNMLANADRDASLMSLIRTL
jgi:hypothetical protein